MVARIDKYDPVSGGFRAKLGFAPVAGDVGTVIPINLDASGLVQKAILNDPNTKGVICLSDRLNSGDIVDVMTDGEIVDITTTQVAGAAAGVQILTGAAGTVSAAGTGRAIGWMVEAWRLVVRLGRVT